MPSNTPTVFRVAPLQARGSLGRPQKGGRTGCVRGVPQRRCVPRAKDKPVKLDDAQYAVTCVACHDAHGESSKMFDELLRRELYKECTSAKRRNGRRHQAAQAGTEAHYPMQEMYEGKGALGVEGKPSPHFTAKAGQAVCVSCHMPASPGAPTRATSPRTTGRSPCPAK